MPGGRSALLINLCNGAVGAFIGSEEVKSEKEMVRITYVPFNSLKKVKTTEVYPTSCVERILPDDTTIPGVHRDYVVIYENAKGQAPFIDKLKKQIADKIYNFREREKGLQLEASQQKFRAREAKEETKKQIATDTELVEKKKSPYDNLFGGRRYDSFRNYMGGEGGDEQY